MRNILLLLSAVVLLCPSVYAQAAEPSKTERVVSGLLDFGAAVMKKRAADREAASTPQAVEANAPAESEESRMTRLGKSVGTLVQGMSDPHFLAEKIATVLRETGELVLREYLEQYKAEGRAYTRELANIITERIVNHDKVASTLRSIRMLCWGVVIYLSVITLLIFFMLWRMKCSNEKVLRAIEELRQRSR